jgi:hypothetical protein
MEELIGELQERFGWCEVRFMAGGYVRFVDTRMGCGDGKEVRRKGVGD